MKHACPAWLHTRSASEQHHSFPHSDPVQNTEINGATFAFARKLLKDIWRLPGRYTRTDVVGRGRGAGSGTRVNLPDLAGVRVNGAGGAGIGAQWKLPLACAVISWVITAMVQEGKGVPTRLIQRYGVFLYVMVVARLSGQLSTPENGLGQILADVEKIRVDLLKIFGKIPDGMPFPPRGVNDPWLEDSMWGSVLDP